MTPARTSTALRVQGLVKHFRAHQAVNDLSFEIERGEIVGLIGPNGAGKSTTMKIITGQVLPDSGQIFIGDCELNAAPREARLRTGYVPQTVQLYPFLTGREHLEFVAGIKGLPTEGLGGLLDETLERFALTRAQHQMAREYSDGMARKLAIALALLGDPALLVLDESLTGLDPRAAAEVKETIRSQSTRGTAILLVSHMLEVVERLCTRVLIMSHGSFVAELDRHELDALHASGRSLEDLFLEKTASFPA
jgi:ABC-2 type transport system ATP-binding protein